MVNCQRVFCFNQMLEMCTWCDNIPVRDGPLEKWWGGGVGNFQLARIFFSLTFFFRWTPLHEFFFCQILFFFLTVKSWFIIYVFLLYKLFYTHNISKDTGHLKAKSFRKCTHSERGGSHLEWTASLCIFSVPSLWNSSPTAHHNDATLHDQKSKKCSRYNHNSFLLYKIFLHTSSKPNSCSTERHFSRASNSSNSTERRAIQLVCEVSKKCVFSYLDFRCCFEANGQ